MSRSVEPARIHLLRANAAPIIVIIRRKPSKLFHIIRWNTRKNRFEHGSWFQGRLYPMRCDVSPDGEWMVYLAMGRKAETWSGVCKVPWLKTFAESDNYGTLSGGGYWDNLGVLQLNGWRATNSSLPFRTQPYKSTAGPSNEGVLFQRMGTAGWRRSGDNWGEYRRIENLHHYHVECIGDDGWHFQPTPKHPILRTKYVGSFDKGATYRFSLDEFPELLDEHVDWATWDYGGRLVYARQGAVYLYEMKDLAKGIPTFIRDFEPLTKESE